MGSTFYQFLLPSAFNVDMGCDGWSSWSHLEPEKTLRMEINLEKQRVRSMAPIDFMDPPFSTRLLISRFCKYSCKRNLLVYG